MTLEDVLTVLGCTTVEVVNAETGEVLCERAEADGLVKHFMEDEYTYNEYYGAEVEDMNIYNNVLTICIEVEEDYEWEWDWEADYTKPEKILGWLCGSF